MSDPTVSQYEHGLFIRLLAFGDKESGLKSAVESIGSGHAQPGLTWTAEPCSFRQVPGAPFAYWIDERLRHLFSEHPTLEAESRSVRVGLQTSDDFRFVRTWWEVPASTILDASNGPNWTTGLEAFQRWCRERSFQRKRWAFFAKGGEYSPFYSDLHLVVNWERGGEEIRR
jgi:hypothetical protein